MFLRNVGDNPFVCVDDVTGQVERLNRVIYNPIHSREINKIILRKSIKARFNINLTDNDLDRLTQYDRLHLQEFVQDLKRTMNIKS